MTATAYRTPFPPLLRWALLADAAASTATGLLLVFGGGLLRDLLGLPSVLMYYAGLSLIPFAALVAYSATRQQPMRSLVWAIAAYNALWMVDSFVLLASGAVTPTLLGEAFVIAQALAVGALALLQYAGLRQATA
jgi:hypothetical protein